MNKKYIRETVLLLTAYVPLIIIIIIQNLTFLIEKSELWWNRQSNTVKMMDLLFKMEVIIKEISHYAEFHFTVFLILLILLSCLKLYKMIKLDRNIEPFKIKVLKVRNKNHEYLTSYIAVYILPFVTLNLASASGMLQFLFLMLVIGYIYLKNGMYYINPTLNFFFKYNIYDVRIEYKNEKQIIKRNIILLSKKNERDLLKAEINVLLDTSNQFLVEQ